MCPTSIQRNWLEMNNPYSDQFPARHQPLWKGGISKVTMNLRKKGIKNKYKIVRAPISLDNFTERPIKIYFFEI